MPEIQKGRVPMRSTKLFCLPYAGGSATVYNKWVKFLDKSIELKPVELAGRGKRYSQPFYNDVNEAVDDILKTICSEIEDSDYAIFGHSMGNLLTYELLNKLENQGYKDPEHIFFSGRCPPHIIKKRQNLYLLPDEEFKECILSIGGTSEEIFESEELCNIFIPVLKADYRIVEEYVYSPEHNYKFNCPITALSGNEDEGTSLKDMLEWEQHAIKGFNNLQFDGGHFFIHTQMQNVIEVINKALIHK
jgi:surfactin synthase thioesterase subunit